VQSTLLAVVRRALPCLVATLTTLVAIPALGADTNIEKQVQVLQKKAIEEDSLNVNYPEAVKKLAAAIGKCDGDKCGVTLKGTLYRDLGAMLVLNGSVDDGRAAFAKALSLDPSLELDPAYKNPMLEGLWADAQKKTGGGGGAATAAPTETGGATESATTTAAPPTGDFAHVAPASQLVRTPIPIYAEYVGTEKLLRVVVKYRGPSMTDWRPLELRKMDTGYGGLIPCKDVTDGVVKYYIQGYGTSDDPIASSGTRTKPYSVPIKAELTGPAPSLPGQEPPRQCAQSVGGTDCPPDFPGCHVAKKEGGEECRRNGECESGQCADGKCVEKKSEGDDCEKDSECASGSCSDSKCTAPKKAGGEACDTDDDCSSGSCKDDKCTAGTPKKSSPSGKVHKVWIGVNLSLDLMFLPQGNNVCKLATLTTGGVAPVNTAGYQCVDPTTGDNFPGTNGTANTQIATGSAASDSLSGGVVPGNFRILASFDYALGMNFLVGARAGYVLFTDPASNPGAPFPPIHLEARLTYLIGSDALTNTVAPMLFVATGASEFDADIGVTATLHAPTGNGAGALPLGTRPENAWLTAGPYFAAVGGGVRILLGSGVAATVAVKGEGAFGGSAGSLLGLAPEIGMQFGL
jgi:hypothetical protein